MSDFETNIRPQIDLLKRSELSVHSIYFSAFKRSLLLKIRDMQAPKHKLYNVAETLFVEQGMNCTAIAEQLGLTEATLSKWRNTMQWEDRRKTQLSTPSKIRTLLLDELENISSGKKSSIDADGLIKVAKTLQYFDSRVALSVVISVFKEFDNWMAEDDPQLAIRFTEKHRQFVNYRAKQDSLK